MKKYFMNMTALLFEKTVNIKEKTRYYLTILR